MQARGTSEPQGRGQTRAPGSHAPSLRCAARPPAEAWRLQPHALLGLRRALLLGVWPAVERAQRGDRRVRARLLLLAPFSLVAARL